MTRLRTYALAISDRVGTYPSFDEYRLALWEAVDLARNGETVTLLQVDGVEADELTFTALCTITPPITPPSTSPEVRST